MKNNYIHPILETVGPEYRNVIFGGSYRYKNLANNCLDMDKASHKYFSGTGK